MSIKALQRGILFLCGVLHLPSKNNDPIFLPAVHESEDEVENEHANPPKVEFVDAGNVLLFRADQRKRISH